VDDATESESSSEEIVIKKSKTPPILQLGTFTGITLTEKELKRLDKLAQTFLPGFEDEPEVPETGILDELKPVTVEVEDPILLRERDYDNQFTAHDTECRREIYEDPPTNLDGLRIPPQCYNGYCVFKFWDKTVKPWAYWCWDEIKSTPKEIRMFFHMTPTENETMNKEALDDIIKVAVEPVKGETKATVEGDGAFPFVDPKEVKVKYEFKLDDIVKCQQRAGVSQDSWWNWAFISRTLWMRRKILIKGLIFCVLFNAALSSFSVKPEQGSCCDDIEVPIEPIVFSANVQGKGKTKNSYRGAAPRGKRTGSKKKVYNNISPGGSEQDADADPEYEEPFDAYVGAYEDAHDPRKYIPRRFQGQSNVACPPARAGESNLRNKISRSKRPITAPPHEILKYVEEMKKVYGPGKKLKPQSFNVSDLSGSIYKFYRVEGERTTYLCTGTHIGAKMWVVLHSLSEDMSVSYLAVNHVRTIVFKASDMKVFGEHLAYFPFQGVRSAFPNSKLKKLEDAAVVTVLGFGHGETSTPDSITGFASPLGWCNAPTRDGDCTSPVLDVNGFVVGFWTHGIEKHLLSSESFGRFEPVTEEMILIAKDAQPDVHVGLDFQLRPHSP